MGDKIERDVHVETQMIHKKRKKKKNYKYIKYKIKAFALFLALITVLSFVYHLLPLGKNDRMKFPAFDGTSFVDGSYFREVNNWFAYNFPWNNHESSGRLSYGKDTTKVLFGKHTMKQNGLGMIFLPSMQDSMESMMVSMSKIKIYSPETRMVALTFDDGPSKYTDRLLDILVENDAKATFYIVGSRVEMFSDTIKKMSDLKMEFGNHTFNHKYLSSIDAKEEKEQLGQVDQAIKEITGKETVTIRPPGGHVDDTPSSAIDKPFIMWSVDTMDWSSRDPDSIEEIIMDNIKDGSVILMHDLYETTVDAMEVVIPKLKEMGYELVTVSVLAETKGYTLEAGQEYRSFPLISVQ